MQDTEGVIAETKALGRAGALPECPVAMAVLRQECGHLICYHLRQETQRGTLQFHG